MKCRVTVRNERGQKVAEAEASNDVGVRELINAKGLPKHWFVVVETTEGTPFGDRLMTLKPVSS